MKFNVLHLAVESQVGKFVGPLLPYLIGSTVMFLNFCKSLSTTISSSSGANEHVE
jgi:hypothetical protein